MSDRYEQDRERYQRDRGQEYDQVPYEQQGRGGVRGMHNGMHNGSPRFHRDFDRDYNQEAGRENYFSMGGPNQGGRYEDQNDWSSRRGAWTGTEGGHRQGSDAGRYADGGSYYGGAGNFGGGMSQYGEQGRHAGRGPKGYKRSDERIREDVSEHLTHDAWVDATEIEIEVKDGEVTLTGTVQSREEKRRAEDAVERVSGVRDVHNQIRVGQNNNMEAARSGTQQSSKSGKST
jgi:osmotically-inducible protein OsmY